MFDLLKKPETNLVDMTELKVYLAHNNVQIHNPTFFKRVNDEVLKSTFEGTFSKEAFSALFLNDDFMWLDCSKRQEPPDLI